MKVNLGRRAGWRDLLMEACLKLQILSSASTGGNSPSSTRRDGILLVIPPHFLLNVLTASAHFSLNHLLIFPVISVPVTHRFCLHFPNLAKSLCLCMCMYMHYCWSEAAVLRPITKSPSGRTLSNLKSNFDVEDFILKGGSQDCHDQVKSLSTSVGCSRAGAHVHSLPVSPPADKTGKQAK